MHFVSCFVLSRRCVVFYIHLEIECVYFECLSWLWASCQCQCQCLTESNAALFMFQYIVNRTVYEWSSKEIEMWERTAWQSINEWTRVQQTHSFFLLFDSFIFSFLYWDLGEWKVSNICCFSYVNSRHYAQTFNKYTKAALTLNIRSMAINIWKFTSQFWFILILIFPQKKQFN